MPLAKISIQGLVIKGFRCGLYQERVFVMGNPILVA